MIKFRVIQKFRKRHVKSKGNMTERLNTRVFGNSAYDVINGGLIKAAHICQLVVGNPPLPAERGLRITIISEYVISISCLYSG